MTGQSAIHDQAADKGAPDGFRPLGPEALRALQGLSGPLYIYAFDTQRVIWANAAALRFWHATSIEELLGRDLSDQSTSTSIRLNEYRAAFARSEERTEGWTFYPKGEPVTAVCHCSGVRLGPDGEQAMLVEIEAIRPYDLLAGELRAVEALRHSPLMISLLSSRGEVLMRNPAAQACFGAMDTALDGHGDHFTAMFADPADAAFLLDAARTAPFARITAPLALPGAPHHAIQLSLVTDPATGRSARLVAQEDISQLTQIRHKLAASEESLQAVLDLNVAPTIVVASATGRVLNANLSASRLLGPRLVLGQPAIGLFAPDSAPEGGYRAMFDDIAAGRRTTAQVQLHGHSGTFWAAASCARIRYENEDAIVSVLTDIDHLYRTAADLEVALSEERITTALQKRSLAFATHEFRSPLAQIDSNAQRLERRAEQFDARQVRDVAGRIRATVKRLLHLIDTALDSGRGNRPGLACFPAPSDLGRLIDSCVRAFAETQPAARIEVALPPLPQIDLDRVLIEQVFANLLSNAVKYASGTPRIRIDGEVAGGAIRVRVRDNGIGVDPADSEQLFGEYVRGSNVGARPGMGLGLSIVRHIIDLHGGTIRFEPCEGPGAMVEIVLPLRPTP